MVKIPRATAKTKADGDGTKLFPSGISSTFLAVRKYWLHITAGETEDMSREEFCEKGFRESYKAVLGLYKGIKHGGKGAAPNPNGAGLTAALHDLENGETNIAFYHLRSFAELVQLPTGLFLLFTQMVSDERRILDEGGTTEDAKAHLLEFLEDVRNVITAVEAHAANREKGKRIFSRTYDAAGEHRHMADANPLKIMSDAFNSGR